MKRQNLLVTALLIVTIILFNACTRADRSRESTASSPMPSAAATPASTLGTGYIYTANERGNTISKIDLGTGQVQNFPTRIAPHNIQISPDGKWLLATGSLPETTQDHSGMGNQGESDEHGSHETGRGRLLILDARTLASESVIDIGRLPAHVVMGAQFKLAYVTNSKDNNVLVVNIAQEKVVGEIKTGEFPHGLRMSPDGREICVANVSDNSVSIISVAESKEVSRIPVGKAPVQVGFTPDGRRVYVSLSDENSVAVVDMVQRKKIATVPVGHNPIQVFATPDSRYVYVANQGTEANSGNTVSVIDTTNNNVVATIITGKGPHGVVVSDDGTRAYITNVVDNTVSVIDTATQKVLQHIKVGDGPNGITYKYAG